MFYWGGRLVGNEVFHKRNRPYYRNNYRLICTNGLCDKVPVPNRDKVPVESATKCPWITYLFHRVFHKRGLSGWFWTRAGKKGCIPWYSLYLHETSRHGRRAVPETQALVVRDKACLVIDDLDEL